MTDELKTLKDLEETSLDLGCDENGASLSIRLKQEAIKWIKAYKNDLKKDTSNNTLGEWGKGYDNGYEACIEYFMEFFNITEEDLKWKTPQQIKNEVEKGCGEEIVTIGTTTYEDEYEDEEANTIYCGDYNNELCLQCRAKLSILTEYDKSIKEMIKVLKEVKKTFSDTKVECPICEKEKRLWVKDENMCYDCKIDEIFRGIK